MLRISNHLVLITMAFTISACSIYRSPDRNNFDADPFTGAPPATAQIVSVDESSIPQSAESAHCLLIAKWSEVSNYKSTPNLQLSFGSTSHGISRENGRARLELARAVGSHLQSGLLCRLEFANAQKFDSELEQMIAQAEEMLEVVIAKLEASR